MLQIDLVQERPEWVCSCYGPGRDPPINLLGGSDLEISPEELRVDHYLKLMNNQGEESVSKRPRWILESIMLLTNF